MLQLSLIFVFIRRQLLSSLYSLSLACSDRWICIQVSGPTQLLIFVVLDMFRHMDLHKSARPYVGNHWPHFMETTKHIQFQTFQNLFQQDPTIQTHLLLNIKSWFQLLSYPCRGCPRMNKNSKGNTYIRMLINTFYIHGNIFNTDAICMFFIYIHIYIYMYVYIQNYTIQSRFQRLQRFNVF